MAETVTEQARPHILILPDIGYNEFEDIGVPDWKQNLFTRIIRNPDRPDRPMRERRCAELLCAILMNCETTRMKILQWFADLAQCTEELGKYEWNFLTEGSTIGAKRDDLRIVGVKTEGEQEVSRIIWSVEVKVQAGFHDTSNPEENDETKDQWVNQVVVYDNWLIRQDERYGYDSIQVSGFVLAKTDMTEGLPKEVSKERWKCTTWTELGQLLAELLREKQIPEIEMEFVRHLLGFIRQYLWSKFAMSENKLDFDHVALLRAFTAIGRECERLVNELVEPIMGHLKNSELGLTDLTHHKVLFKTEERSIVYGCLCADSKDNGIWVCAGFANGAIRFWIESHPKHLEKYGIIDATKKAISEQSNLILDWETSARDKDWRDLKTEMPFAKLLAKTDQPSEIEKFVTNALKDFEKMGLPAKLREICNK